MLRTDFTYTLPPAQDPRERGKLAPAETYEIRTTFADGFYSAGPLNDVQGGDVRQVVTTIRTRRLRPA